MNKQLVEMVGPTFSIEKITCSMGQVTYKVKQGSRYVGKTAEGGYKSLSSARAYAQHNRKL